MAKRHHSYQRRYNRRRHNPFGISGGVVKEAAYNAAGALGSLLLASQFNFSGWAGVAATAASAVGVSIAGKFVGGASAQEELLKGGLTAAIISALQQAGFAKNLGLGLYAPAWFGVPTASSQYLRSYPGNMPGNPVGAGSVLLGPGGAVAVAGPTAAGTGMGYHRFRSRYTGNY